MFCRYLSVTSSPSRLNHSIFIKYLSNFTFHPFSVRETHEIAQAQQEKNAKLREAFGISEYFVEGTSFDPQRQAKEELAKSEALQKKLAEEREHASKELSNKKYALVKTPSPDKENEENDDDDEDFDNEKEKKVKKSKKEKKKKRSRDS